MLTKFRLIEAGQFLGLERWILDILFHERFICFNKKTETSLKLGSYPFIQENLFNIQKIFENMKTSHFWMLNNV